MIEAGVNTTVTLASVMLYNDCTPEGLTLAASSIRCVLCDTGSVMFSIHSGIYFKFTTGFLLSHLWVLLIVWGHNTAILSAKSSWSNKICLCWSEKTCQDIWTLGECATNEREVVRVVTHFSCVATFDFHYRSSFQEYGQQKLFSWHKTRFLFLKFFDATIFIQENAH